jgi:hypothetical protein
MFSYFVKRKMKINSTKVKMIAMTEDFSRITIRLKAHEQNAFRALISQVRQKVGYEVPATEIVKSLMGFKTKLAQLSNEDRSILIAPERKHGPGRPIDDLGEGIPITHAKKKA